MNYKKLIGGLGLAVVLASSTGCSSTGSKHDERSEGRVKDDENITAKIKKELKEEPVYKFDDVGVATFAGAVQLSGFVKSEEQKRRAQQVAESVGGVNQVYNGLAIKPFAPSPTGLSSTNMPAARIYADPPTEPPQREPIQPTQPDPNQAPK